MNEKIEAGTVRSRASVAGLWFGLISISYVFVSGWIGLLKPAILGTVLSLILWTAKFVGCILLMRFYMKRLCARYEGVTRRDTFRFGLLTALFSALLYGAFTMMYFTYIQPDAFAEVLGAVAQSGGFTSDQLDILTRFESKLPLISSVTNFIWAFLYGTVLSAILSRGIPKTDFFEE